MLTREPLTSSIVARLNTSLSGCSNTLTTPPGNKETKSPKF